MTSNGPHKHLAMAMSVLILLELVFSASAQGDGINQLCRTSDFKNLCNKMVRGATNWHDATKNAVESALNQAIEMQKMLTLLDQAVAHISPVSKESVMATCRDNFDGAVDNLKGALEFLEKNDTGGLNSYLSAAGKTSDCTEAFDQFGSTLPPAVAKKMEVLTQEVDNCLAVSQQI